MKYLHYTFLTLTIAWMATIFIFSSQNGETSSNTSGTVVTFITDTFIPDFDEYSSAKQQDIIDTITLIIRKGAHFTEYAILGFLSFFTMITFIWKKHVPTTTVKYGELFRKKRTNYGIISLIFTCLYAISDELHQGFVADRSPAILDVIIDTAGGLAGIFVACFFIYLYLRRVKKQQRKF